MTFEELYNAIHGVNVPDDAREKAYEELRFMEDAEYIEEFNEYEHNRFIYESGF